MLLVAAVTLGACLRFALGWVEARRDSEALSSARSELRLLYPEWDGKAEQPPKEEPDCTTVRGLHYPDHLSLDVDLELAKTEVPRTTEKAIKRAAWKQALTDGRISSGEEWVTLGIVRINKRTGEVRPEPWAEQAAASDCRQRADRAVALWQKFRSTPQRTLDASPPYQALKTGFALLVGMVLVRSILWALGQLRG